MSIAPAHAAPGALCGRISLEGKHLVVEAQPHVIIRLRRHFPRCGAQHGTVRLTATPEVARDLRWFMERFPLEVHAGAAARFHALADEQLRREAAVAQVLAGRADALALAKDYPLSVPLRPYQVVGAELAYRSRGLLNADDLGLGKTAQAIALMARAECRPALVVCYPHLQTQWAREIARFAPALTVHELKKGSPYDLCPPARNRLLTPRFPDVIISTYHKLSGWAEVLAATVRTVVFDEAQELRRPDSAKYSAAKHIAEAASWRLGLSATPFYNYGGEMHSVLGVLAPGALGDHAEFVAEWCHSAYSDKPRLADPRAFGTYARSSGLMLRRTRAEVGRELPEVSIAAHQIDADPKVLDTIADRSAELARVILAQDSSWEERGEAAREFDLRLRQATGLSKAVYVAEFVRMLLESEERVVLYGWHRAVYDVWLDRLKEFRPVLYTGSESPVQKERSRVAFTSGDARVLIISLRAGAGLDGLQHSCRTVVFGELDWSPGVHEQATGRVHRDGQTDPVVAYYLIADRGSDPVVWDVIGAKLSQMRGVRDPDAELVERLEVDVDRIKKLAQAYASKGAKA